MECGDGCVLVIMFVLYWCKVASIRAALLILEYVFLVGGVGDDGIGGGGLRDFDALLAVASDWFMILLMVFDDMALLHFTSGMMGVLKGVVYVHGVVVVYYVTVLVVLDLYFEDVFWCMVDLGWVIGMSYGIVVFFIVGVMSIVDEVDFDVECWYCIFEE